ncbi:hypothetical protein L195_g038854, partial [Trifolium pratense]
FIQRVFSIDTVVKPLPPVMAYNVSRNLNFFTRIFTQFFASPTVDMSYHCSSSQINLTLHFEVKSLLKRENL